MKAKLLSIIALSTAALLSSCDMDLKPQGALEEGNALQSTNDARRFRNGFYTSIRGLGSSQFFTLAEIQADCFNGLTINGNRMGTLANGTVLSSDSDISTYWTSFFYYINNINYFLEYVEPLLQEAIEANLEDKAQEYAHYIGEAHFFRGYLYAEMFDRWCQVYTSENAEKDGLGLPIVTKYAPTADRSKYPGRGTMKATVDFIKQELELGHAAMLVWEENNPQYLTPMASFLSSKAVEAMQARLALWISDYDTAIQKAKSVINSGIYTLATTSSQEKDNGLSFMWTVDYNNEIIFMPYEDNQELGASIGSAWIGALNDQADYIPASNVIETLQLYYNRLTNSGDVRYQTYIGTRNLKSNFGLIGTPCFNKFPGNPALMTSSTPNIINKPKIFRLSEMYLILAEASYQKGDISTANATMKEFKEHRYSQPKNFAGYPDLSGNELFEDIKTQRTIELIGEGFRLSDLRRWKMGFVREANYADMNTVGLSGVAKDDISLILTPAGLEVSYEPNDHRYTWPIPSDELNVNPQMKGQQNPGY